MNIDRTHKENILYVEDKGIMLCANSSNLSNISLEDMYNFVKEDLALAQYNQINEEEEMEFDEDGFPISFPNNSEVFIALGASLYSIEETPLQFLELRNKIKNFDSIFSLNHRIII